MAFQVTNIILIKKFIREYSESYIKKGRFLFIVFSVHTLHGYAANQWPYKVIRMVFDALLTCRLQVFPLRTGISLPTLTARCGGSRVRI